MAILSYNSRYGYSDRGTVELLDMFIQKRTILNRKARHNK